MAVELMSSQLSSLVYYFLGWVEDEGFDAEASPERYTLRDFDEWIDQCVGDGGIVRVRHDLDVYPEEFEELRQALQGLIGKYGHGTPLSDHVDPTCMEAEDDDFIF